MTYQALTRCQGQGTQWPFIRHQRFLTSKTVGKANYLDKKLCVTHFAIFTTFRHGLCACQTFCAKKRTRLLTDTDRSLHRPPGTKPAPPDASGGSARLGGSARVGSALDGFQALQAAGAQQLPALLAGLGAQPGDALEVLAHAGLGFRVQGSGGLGGPRGGGSGGLGVGGGGLVCGSGVGVRW